MFHGGCSTGDGLSASTWFRIIGWFRNFGGINFLHIYGICIWFMPILKGLKEEIGLLYKWSREMPTISAVFLDNCHASSIHSLQQSPEIMLRSCDRAS